MPTYTYRCKYCDYQFDQYQRMMDDPLTDCPNCSEPQLRKVINSAGIVFKGSGFYVTDNRNGSVSQKKDANSEPKNNSDSGSKTNTESSSKTKPSEKAAA